MVILGTLLWILQRDTRRLKENSDQRRWINQCFGISQVQRGNLNSQPHVGKLCYLQNLRSCSLHFRYWHFCLDSPWLICAKCTEFDWGRSHYKQKKNKDRLSIQSNSRHMDGVWVWVCVSSCTSETIYLLLTLRLCLIMHVICFNVLQVKQKCLLSVRFDCSHWLVRCNLLIALMGTLSSSTLRSQQVLMIY